MTRDSLCAAEHLLGLLTSGWERTWSFDTSSAVFVLPEGSLDGSQHCRRFPLVVEKRSRSVCCYSTARIFEYSFSRVVHANRCIELLQTNIRLILTQLTLLGVLVGTWNGFDIEGLRQLLQKHKAGGEPEGAQSS